jgi:hypothetical protein
MHETSDRLYRVRCDCGVTKTVFATAFLNPRGTVSCGCHRAENKGPRHHWWNHANAEMDFTKRWARPRAFNAWSARVRRRDGDCDMCGSTRHLQAHHLDGWHAAPEKRYDMSNGIALCRNCHARYHADHKGAGITRASYRAFKRRACRKAA